MTTLPSDDGGATTSRTRRVRLVVAYDGAPFRGFARNEGVTTVAGVLEEHLGKVLGHPVQLTAAGRTDAGVHAWGQVVTFDTTAADLDLDRLQRSTNRVCGPRIVVREAALASPDVDARFSARWRRYRYSVLTSPVPNPFLAATTWHVADPLDVDAMRDAGRRFVGVHDFSSFCRRPPAAPGRPERSLERTVLDVAWERVDPDVLRMEITAVAFCHQMVRSIVGMLVAVGRGRRTPDDVDRALAARDRSAAAELAPPQGLCLWEVGYGDVPRLQASEPPG